MLIIFELYYVVYTTRTLAVWPPRLRVPRKAGHFEFIPWTGGWTAHTTFKHGQLPAPWHLPNVWRNCKPDVSCVPEGKLTEVTEALWLGVWVSDPTEDVCKSACVEEEGSGPGGTPKARKGHYFVKISPTAMENVNTRRVQGANCYHLPNSEMTWSITTCVCPWVSVWVPGGSLSRLNAAARDDSGFQAGFVTSESLSFLNSPSMLHTENWDIAL